jgi:hypothetical protein
MKGTHQNGISHLQRWNTLNVRSWSIIPITNKILTKLGPGQQDNTIAKGNKLGQPLRASSRADLTERALALRAKEAQVRNLKVVLCC